MLAQADVVIAMTDQQKSDLLKLFPGADGKPVHTLREFADEAGDIEDPFEQGDEKFTEVRIEIKRLIPAVADRILGADWSLDD
jgi:protein-tyrosine-phosphatase